MTRLTPTQALINAIERDRGGIAVVWWPTFDLRDWLIEEVRSLVPDSARVDVVSSVDEALARPDRAALLVPVDERDVITDLDGCRDLLLDRTQPLVLFLARDGDGARLLRHHPSLASWIRGNDVDPEAMSEIDVEEERKRFASEVGEPPERWLERWNAGQTERTGVNYTRAYWAAMLVSS